MEELSSTTKNARERLESVGSAGKSMGDGIAGGASSGTGALDSMGGALSSAGSNLSALGDAGASAGLQITNSFENAASASDDLGTSFAKNYNKATAAGKGFSDSIKTGISGAVDTAKKKVTSFVKDTADGAKKIGNAFLHPIQTLKGKFSGAMKDAAGETGKVGDAAEDSEKALEDMGDKGSGAGGKLKSGLGGALKVLGAIALAAAVVVGIAKFTSAALDASQAANNIAYSFDQTFGDSAPDVEGWADNFSSAVHRSESQVKSFLASNKQMYDGMGLTSEAGDQLSKVTTSLAYDIGNFTGMADEEALSKLQDAIGGNESALSDLGVRLDDTTLKQTAMEMGLGSNIDAMDEATLAQVRMNAILEQTGDIQGAATDSIGGFSGGVKALQGAWTSFLEKAGSKLAPVFEKVFGIIMDLWPKIEPQLMNLVELLADGFEQAIPFIAELAETLLPILFGLFEQIMPVLGMIGETLLPVLSSVLGTVATALQPLMGLFATLVEVLLPPLAAIFGTLVETLLPPLASLFGALSPILEGLSPIFDIIAGAVGLVSDAIATLIGWITSAIDKLAEFGEWAGSGLSWVGDTVGGAWDATKDFFTGNAKGTDNFSGGWTNVHEAGDELIYAKHGGGMAYLPQGSSILPASTTKDILTGSSSIVPSQTFQSTLPPSSGEDFGSGKVIDITHLLPKQDSSDKDDKPEGDGGDTPKKAPPPPDPTWEGEPPKPDTPNGTPPSTRTLNINLTVTSNGSLSLAELDSIKGILREVVKEEMAEINDDDLTFRAVQNGLVG